MPVHEAEAVSLRQYPLSEADRIVVLFTREAGLLRAVAPGAKRTKSRFGACLQPLNHVRVEYYMREGQPLCRIRQCEILHSYLGRNPSLDRVGGFAYFAELTQELTQENNPAPLVFRLLLASLNAGEKLGVHEPLLRYFETWMLRLNGLLPNYDYCSSCGSCVKQLAFYIRPESGQSRCPECARGKGTEIGASASQILGRMRREPPEEFARTPFPDGAARQLERLSREFLDYHLERKLKSFRVLKEMLEGGDSPDATT